MSACRRFIAAIESFEYSRAVRHLRQRFHGIHQSAGRLPSAGESLGACAAFQLRHRFVYHARIRHTGEIRIESEGAAREGECLDGVIAAERSRRLMQKPRHGRHAGRRLRCVAAHCRQAGLYRQSRSVWTERGQIPDLPPTSQAAPPARVSRLDSDDVFQRAQHEIRRRPQTAPGVHIIEQSQHRRHVAALRGLLQQERLRQSLPTRRRTQLAHLIAPLFGIGGLRIELLRCPPQARGRLWKCIIIPCLRGGLAMRFQRRNPFVIASRQQ